MIAPTPEMLRAAPFEYDFMERRDYSILTYHELLPETQDLARELASAHTTVYDKIMAINNWLGGPDFLYSLDVPPLPPVNGIDHFIHEARRGHCELYASALTLMARSLGIPARVVSGYRGGDYNASDQAYLVRANMAHLWVEVLFNGVGWVRMDPAPRADPQLSALRRMRMAWSVYALRGKMFWYQSVIGFESGIRLDQWRWPWRRARHPESLDHATSAPDNGADSESLPHDYTAFSTSRPVRISALGALAICVGLAWQRWRRARRKIVRLTPEQQQARRLFQRFVRKASALGVSCDNQTANEIAEALIKRNLLPPEAIGAFIAWYHDVRFGRGTLKKQEHQQFIRFVRSM